jgi:hypothetical protein
VTRCPELQAGLVATTTAWTRVIRLQLPLDDRHRPGNTYGVNYRIDDTEYTVAVFDLAQRRDAYRDH